MKSECCLIFRVVQFFKQNVSSGADGMCSNNEVICHGLSNTKVNFHVHRNPPLGSVLSQMTLSKIHHPTRVSLVIF